jgi:hypothetical protein
MRLLLLLFFSFPLFAHKYELSICAIFQDEARFLKEWIEFHRLVGVDHFYLVNHNSQDHYKAVLNPYIKAGVVELFETKERPNGIAEWNDLQCSIYEKIIDRSVNETKWLALLDTDEFLYPVEKNTLKACLEDYLSFGAVGVNWQVFGTSGVEKIPEDALLIENLCLRAPKNHPGNNHIKSIIRPKAFASCPNPHSMCLKPPFFQVTENKQHFEGPFSPCVSVDILCINHYWPRDEEFFHSVKIKRQLRWGIPPEACFKANDTLNQEFDDRILRFRDALQARMFPL